MGTISDFIDELTPIMQRLQVLVDEYGVKEGVSIIIYNQRVMPSIDLDSIVRTRTKELRSEPSTNIAEE